MRIDCRDRSGRWGLRPVVAAARPSSGGIAFLGEEHFAEMIADGRLIRVLDDWCAPFDGYYLYNPSRRQPSPAFALFMDMLRADTPS